jgi:hypothetical protein
MEKFKNENEHIKSEIESEEKIIERNQKMGIEDLEKTYPSIEFSKKDTGGDNYLPVIEEDGELREWGGSYGLSVFVDESNNNFYFGTSNSNGSSGFLLKINKHLADRILEEIVERAGDKAFDLWDTKDINQKRRILESIDSED